MRVSREVFCLFELFLGFLSCLEQTYPSASNTRGGAVILLSQPYLSAT